MMVQKYTYWHGKIIIIYSYALKVGYRISYRMHNLFHKKCIFVYLYRKILKDHSEDIKNGYFWLAEILHVLHSFFIVFPIFFGNTHLFLINKNVHF